MPVKENDSLGGDHGNDSLVEAVADIVHAAGVTSALSFRTAQKIVDASEAFFFGEQGEVKPLASRSCSQLRALRLERRRTRRAMQKLIARESSPEPERMEASAIQAIRSASPGNDVQKSALSAETEFSAWLVQLQAKLEAHVGANSPEEAITIAAEKLPENIVFAKAIKEQPL